MGTLYNYIKKFVLEFAKRIRPRHSYSACYALTYLPPTRGYSGLRGAPHHVTSVASEVLTSLWMLPRRASGLRFVTQLLTSRSAVLIRCSVLNYLGVGDVRWHAEVITRYCEPGPVLVSIGKPWPRTVPDTATTRCDTSADAVMQR